MKLIGLLILILLLSCSKEETPVRTNNVVFYSTGTYYEIQIKGVHGAFYINHTDFIPACTTPGQVTMYLKEGRWDVVLKKSNENLIKTIEIKGGCNAFNVSKW